MRDENVNAFEPFKCVGTDDIFFMDEAGIIKKLPPEMEKDCPEPKEINPPILRLPE